MIPSGNQPRPRILVAGIGNIFMGDDAFGVHVAQRLAQCNLSPEVRIADFGIRGLDLAYALLDEYEMVIFVDATQRGGAPGTLYVIEPDLDNLGDTDNSSNLLDAHSMDPVKVLRVAAFLGAKPKRLLLVGCEPEEFGTEGMELSPVVHSALDEAISIIQRLIDEHSLAGAPEPHPGSAGGKRLGKEKI